MSIITKQGLRFSYYGDKILMYWPWVKRGYYHSQLFSRDFNSFRDYWKMVGAEESLIKTTNSSGKMTGFSTEEVLSQWSARLYSGEHVVLLMNVDPYRKGPSFWSRLTSEQKEILMKDIVVLHCKDKREMEALIDSTSREFADAYGFLNGKLIYSNEQEF